jgi:RNA polymerase sigma-70 factor, ECF subfamily
MAGSQRARALDGGIVPRPADGSRDCRELDPASLTVHSERLFRAAYALCRSREDAEDLVQDTYARVLKKPRLLRRDEDLGYLLKVMRNTWINTYQLRLRRPRTVPFDDATERLIEHTSRDSHANGSNEVYDAVAELPISLRETIVAIDVLGLSYREASAALGVPPGTIMSRLYRARKGVAARLEQAGVAPFVIRA